MSPTPHTLDFRFPCSPTALPWIPFRSDAQFLLASPLFSGRSLLCCPVSNPSFPPLQQPFLTTDCHPSTPPGLFCSGDCPDSDSMYRRFTVGQTVRDRFINIFSAHRQSVICRAPKTTNNQTRAHCCRTNDRTSDCTTLLSTAQKKLELQQAESGRFSESKADGLRERHEKPMYCTCGVVVTKLKLRSTQNERSGCTAVEDFQTLRHSSPLMKCLHAIAFYICLSDQTDPYEI